MKKVISLLMVFMILVSMTCFSTSVYAQNAESEEVMLLSALQIIPDGYDYTSDSPIKRDEFAYIASRFADLQVFEPIDTVFSDVKADNEYSGYIKHLSDLGYVQGDGTGNFMPDESLSLAGAAKIITMIIGYNDFAVYNGGYSNGYLGIALDLGFLDNVTNDKNGNITKAGTVQFIYNALTTEIDALGYYVSDGKISSAINNRAKDTYIASKLGISAYYGTVVETDVKDFHIKFNVTSNKYKTNNVLKNNGDSMYLECDYTLNIYEYDHAPVIIWVDRDEKIVAIKLQKNIEIRYEAISSVNNDENTQAQYNKINTITLMNDSDEVYDVSDVATYKFNGENVTQKLCFAGKYARIIFDGDEVVHIESWDLKTGGIIQQASINSISYISGEKKGELTNISEKNVLYFVEGRYASQKEVKTDTLFDYYLNDELAVFVVSEHVVYDKLKSASFGAATIGNYSYKMNIPFFWSVNGKDYKKISDKTSYDAAVAGEFLNIFDIDVKAYVALNGKISYITPASQDGMLNNTFYGIVIGGNYDSFKESGDLKLLDVSDNQIVEKQYAITEKTKFLDGINISVLEQNSSDGNGNGIYKFKVNPSGNILEISKPHYLDNIPPVSFQNSSFYDNGSVALVMAGSKGIVFTGEPILAVYNDENGDLCAKFVTWYNLRGGYIGEDGATITFYGEDKSEHPELIVLSGDIDQIGYSIRKTGLIIEKNLSVDENGDYCYFVEMLVSGQLVEKKVNLTEYENYKERTYINFYDELLFSTSDVKYSSTLLDLSGNEETWTKKNATLIHGVIDEAFGTKVYLTNGEFYYNTTSSDGAAVIKYNRNKDNFTGSTAKDLISGKEVYIYYNSDQLVSLYIIVE